MGSKNGESPKNEYTFLINVKTGCVREFFYHDPRTGKQVVHEFENYRINIPLNKDEIELKLPKDTRITEM